MFVIPFDMISMGKYHEWEKNNPRPKFNFVLDKDKFSLENILEIMADLRVYLGLQMEMTGCTASRVIRTYDKEDKTFHPDPYIAICLEARKGLLAHIEVGIWGNFYEEKHRELLNYVEAIYAENEAFLKANAEHKEKYKKDTGG